jgi:glycerophosphoryl diester phosphodiesterase
VDVRKTRDGKLILLHDPTFKRVAGVDISPRQVDYEYIRQNIRIDGEIVPTLEEVLEFIN